MVLKIQRRNKNGIENLPPACGTGGNLSLLTQYGDVHGIVDENELSLKNLALRLKPGGYLLVTVPAFMGLWSGHDASHHHKRRYTKGKLTALMKQANFDIIISSYFNMLLFTAIAASRLSQKLLKRATGDELTMPPEGLNWFLARLFAAERHFLPYFSLPFGVSLLVVGRKPA